VSSSSTETGTRLVDVTMPQMGVSVAEGTVVAWRAGVGDPIKAEETICEISTDKIDTEVPSPATGVVAEILVEVEQTVEVGVVLARIAVESLSGEAQPEPEPGPAATTPAPTPVPSAPAPAASTPAAAPAPAAPRRNGNGRRYSPVVQRIAAEHDINLDTITGTGRGGRVRKQDVLAVVESGDAPADAPLHIESPYRPEPAQEPPGRLPRVRRQIGEHMKRSLETAATCTTWIEVDMTRIEAARERFGFTALPFVARAAIAALRDHPSLNAWLEGERYTRHEGVNLGIAVSLGEDGLIVPVVDRAHEVRGGTFTITNPGQYGSIMATPIINQPQVAILDLEAIVKRPVVVSDADGNDSIAIRSMTILGLSWDHRALDGVDAAQFLATIKRHLEGWTGA
jgi:pyruvate/2-oxoglutarate dehydrogenase complex dihydrolipoamide acyltransferase (E2) component